MNPWRVRQARSFDADAASVRAARRFVQDVLAEAGQDHVDASLFTSELVSNSVDDAHTVIDVVVLINDLTVRVEVHDGFSMTEAFRVLVETEREMVEVTAVSGRGLSMIRKAAVHLGVVDKGLDGKAVWFELSLATDTSPVAG